MPTTLKLSQLKVAIDEQPIVKGVSLTVKPGEVQAIMGPNGSGKSTLAQTLAGHPAYTVTGGSVKLGRMNLLDKSPDERAQAGLFLAFQYPVEVPGVKVWQFLRQAHNARFADQPKKLFAKAIDFRNHLESLAETLKVKKSLLRRGLNEGFSGGEKKRLEILQMAVLEPKFAILDETDSGLDVDAIKAVAAGINHIVKTYQTGVLMITHYRRILDYVKPAVVHMMIDGQIKQTGDMQLVDAIEDKGYHVPLRR